jgi:hypothetical protein
LPIVRVGVACSPDTRRRVAVSAAMKAQYLKHTLKQIKIRYIIQCGVDWVAQSVWRLATGWTVRGSNPGVGEIFRTCPDQPWGPLSLLYNEYRVFPGGRKRPGRDADPSPPFTAKV